MSYDLWVWKAPAYTLKTINHGIARLEAGDEEAFAADPTLRTFRQRLVERLPLNASGRVPESRAWATTPGISYRLVELNLSFAIRDDQLDQVVRLVDELDLWLYDPQRALVQPPRSQREAVPLWRRLLGR